MNSLMSISIKDAKRAFFDRRAVTGAMDRKRRKVLSKFGAFVRQRARSSMRPARQKSLSEMSQAELIDFQEYKRRAEAHGLKAKRPLASSKPGEPPRVITGLLKKFLFFVFDAQKGSVVIGPAALNAKDRSAPANLEYGGSIIKGGHRFQVEARPFMAPAFEAELGGLPSLWAGALAGN
jgi:hypothetical protein